MKIIYKLRGFLAALPLIFSFFWLQKYSNTVLYASWAGGLDIFLFGLFIRIWGIQHLHYRIRSKTLLTTTGPYQFMRNPLYIGNTSLCVGVVLFSGHWWLAPITLVYCYLLYNMVILHEEKRLEGKYGEPYLEFCRKIPRWIPKSPEEKQPWNFITEDLGKTLKVELPTLLLILLFAARQYYLLFYYQ